MPAHMTTCLLCSSCCEHHFCSTCLSHYCHITVTWLSRDITWSYHTFAVHFVYWRLGCL